MTLPILIALFAIFFFGGIAIMAEIKARRAERLFAQQEEQRQQLYWEKILLQAIETKLDYSLDTQTIADTILNNIEHIIPFSSASAMVLTTNKAGGKPEKIHLKILLKNPLNQSYIDTIKSSMTQSLTQLYTKPLPATIEETHMGSQIDEQQNKQPKSFFHIPLFVNNEVTGLITIASSEEDVYKDQQMTILYRLTQRAMHILSQFSDVLHREKGKLTTLSSNLKAGVFMLDLKEQVTVINTAAKSYLNITKDNPTITDILAALPPNYDLGFKIQSAINDNHVIAENEITMGDKTFSITITPVLSEHGENKNVIGALVVLHNITLEKELVKMKEDFTSIIVHELRSPITSIKASSDLLTSQTPLTDEERQKLLSLIHEQANKMLQEVSLILDSAKIEAGMFKIQKIKSDLKKVIDEKIAIFAPLAQEKFVTLNSDIDSTLQPFAFDPHHVGQVISNLCSNSLKFTPSGGRITVTAKQAPPSPAGGTGFVTISVSDTGAGVAKEKQHLLFSKFSQIQTSNSNKGTGLGLYFVKGVVEAHGGTITLESEVGKGTTITFTLPVDISSQIAFQTPTTNLQNKPLVN